MIYLPTQNLYLGKYGLYTQNEIDYAEYLEKEQLKKKQVFSLHQWIEIFPTAKRRIRQNLQSHIKQFNADLGYALDIERQAKNLSNNIHRLQDKEFFMALVEALYINPLRKDKIRQIKRCKFLLSTLKPQDPNSDKITDKDIARAKEVPIDLYIEFNSAGFASCIWHHEAHPSLKYYKDQNHVHCFSGCGRHDSIDVVMKLRQCSFSEAVKFLVNK